MGKDISQEAYRKLVLDFAERNSLKYTIARFRGELQETTIRRIVKRKKMGLGYKRKPKKISKTMQIKKKRIIAAAQHKVGVSTKKLANRFKIIKSMAWRTLKEIGNKYFKRRSAPKVTENEKIKQIQILKDVSEFVSKKKKTDLILYDESYFSLSDSRSPANVGFYSHPNELQNVADNIRLKPKAKFERRVLVWIAISKRGISNLLVLPSKSEALTSSVYIKKCFKKNLLPFKKKKLSSW